MSTIKTRYSFRSLKTNCYAYGRRFDIKHSVDVMKRMSIKRGRSKAYNQVRFFFFNALNCTFTDFLPEASFSLRVLSLPASACLCVNHEIIHMITHDLLKLESQNDLLKLESQNLGQKCKAPWLRSVLFGGN